jgi:hypothetical protein
MGTFDAECSQCGSTSHRSSDCPHGLYSSECSHCGSKDHASSDCPHGLYSSECSHCGSKDHASSDCPHGLYSSECSHCGSTGHASGDCPHGLYSSECSHCGSKNHASHKCPHGLFTSRPERPTRRAADESPDDLASASNDTGCAQVIGWLVAVVVIVTVAIWLAVNIVLPVVLLNSAFILTILALFLKPRRTLLSSLALVGGCYMLIDISNGWFSASFVRNVVKNPHWITGFVYVNAAAVTLSTWQLVRPLLAAAAPVTVANRRKSLWRSGAGVALICTAAVLLPFIYHTVRNPFVGLTTAANTYTDQSQVTSSSTSADAEGMSDIALPGQPLSHGSSNPPPKAALKSDEDPSAPSASEAGKPGYWIDDQTSLMWTEKDNGYGIDWNRASEYCSGLTLAGFNGWRLPSIDELQGIVDPEAGGRPWIYEGTRYTLKIREPIQLSSCCVWSGTKSGSSEAWLFFFHNGNRYTSELALSSPALCVRVSDR